MLQRMLGGRVGIDDSLYQRVGSQTVATVQPRTRALTDGIQTLYRRAAVQVHLDAAAHIVGCGPHGDIVGSDVNAQRETFLIDIGEVVACLCRVFMRHVEADMVQTVNLHLLVDGACHDVARSQREAFVVFLHERLAVGQTQDASVATHGLGDEEGGMRLSGREERCGMELHELHVLHRSLGTVDHRLAVARSDDGVGCRLVDGTATTSTHQRDLREVGVHLLRVGIQDVSAIAVDIGCAPRDTRSEVVLRDNLHGEVVLLHLDVGTCPDGSHQSALYLGSCVVGVVEDAELRVTSLAVEVEIAVLVFVEVDTPPHQFLDLLRGIPDHLLHSLAVADIVAGNHRVFDVFLEIVYGEIGHRGDTTLRKTRVGLVELGLTDEAHLSFLRPGHFQGVAHTGYSAADDEEVILIYHRLSVIIAMLSSRTT